MSGAVDSRGCGKGPAVSGSFSCPMWWRSATKSMGRGSVFGVQVGKLFFLEGSARQGRGFCLVRGLGECGITSVIARSCCPAWAGSPPTPRACRAGACGSSTSAMVFGSERCMSCTYFSAWVARVFLFFKLFKIFRGPGSKAGRGLRGVCIAESTDFHRRKYGLSSPKVRTFDKARSGASVLSAMNSPRSQPWRGFPAVTFSRAGPLPWPWPWPGDQRPQGSRCRP